MSSASKICRLDLKQLPPPATAVKPICIPALATLLQRQIHKTSGVRSKEVICQHHQSCCDSGTSVSTLAATMNLPNPTATQTKASSNLLPQRNSRSSGVSSPSSSSNRILARCAKTGDLASTKPWAVPLHHLCSSKLLHVWWRGSLRPIKSTKKKETI